MGVSAVAQAAPGIGVGALVVLIALLALGCAYGHKPRWPRSKRAQLSAMKGIQGAGKGKGASPRSGVVRGTEPNDARRASGATFVGVEGVAAQACGARGRYGARGRVCARDARLARPGRERGVWHEHAPRPRRRARAEQAALPALGARDIHERGRVLVDVQSRRRWCVLGGPWPQPRHGPR